LWQVTQYRFRRSREFETCAGGLPVSAGRVAPSGWRACGAAAGIVSAARVIEASPAGQHVLLDHRMRSLPRFPASALRLAVRQAVHYEPRDSISVEGQKQGVRGASRGLPLKLLHLLRIIIGSVDRPGTWLYQGMALAVPQSHRKGMGFSPWTISSSASTVWNCFPAMTARSAITCATT